MTSITAKRIGISIHKHQSQQGKITRRKRRYCNAVQTKSMYFVTSLFILAWASVVPLAAAQQVKVCSCTPLTYRMVFDFSREFSGDECIQIATDGGNKGSTCTYDIGPDFDGDLKPAVITNFSFSELDQSLAGIKVLNQFNTRIEDGDEVEYESVTAIDSEVITGGISASFTAINQANQTFELSFLLRFSNLCEILPFSVGDRLGYLAFTEIDLPRQDTCDLASVSPTEAPSMFPSIYSSHSPSTNPSSRPSSIPTTNLSSPPTKDPTPLPTITPTASPSFIPTMNPTSSPTKIRSGIPSPSPSRKPTTSPSDAPTDSPSFRPTKNPTPSPTKVNSGIPSASPTKKPTASPSKAPTDSPSVIPTKNPTPSPTTVYSDIPSSSPTQMPMSAPVISPPVAPSSKPTESPTKKKSPIPSMDPTPSPSVRPSLLPTIIDVTLTPTPTALPTSSPTEVKPTVFHISNSPSVEPSQAPTTDCYGKGKGYLRDNNVSKMKGKGKKKGKDKKKCKGKGKKKSKKNKKGKGSKKSKNPASSKGKGKKSSKSKGKKTKKKHYNTPSIVEPNKNLGIPIGDTLFTETLVTTIIPNPQGLRGVR